MWSLRSCGRYGKRELTSLSTVLSLAIDCHYQPWHCSNILQLSEKRAVVTVIYNTVIALDLLLLNSVSVWANSLSLSRWHYSINYVSCNYHIFLLPHYSPHFRNVSGRSVRFWRTLSYFLFCIFSLHRPQYQVRFVLSCFQSDSPPVSNWLTVTMFQSCDHPDEEFDSTGHVETTVFYSWSSLLLCGLLHGSDPNCADCGSRRLRSCLRLRYVCSTISLGEVSGLGRLRSIPLRVGTQAYSPDSYICIYTVPFSLPTIPCPSLCLRYRAPLSAYDSRLLSPPTTAGSSLCLRYNNNFLQIGTKLVLPIDFWLTLKMYEDYRTFVSTIFGD